MSKTSVGLRYYEWVLESKQGGRRRQGAWLKKSHRIYTLSPHFDIDWMNKDLRVDGQDKNKDNEQWFTSQLGQDKLVLSLYQNKHQGYFVDLASNEWRGLSNTLALERYYNWTGICIEPLPGYLQGILEQRRCSLVTNPVSSVVGNVVSFHRQEAFSGIVSSMTNNHKKDASRDLHLTTVALTSILEHLHAPLVIDYLSLDVEGAELLVLEGLNFDKYTFLVMSVERPSAKVYSLLARNRYWFLSQLPLDDTTNTNTNAAATAMSVSVLPNKHIANKPSGSGAFGECMYLHESHPDFNAHMIKYRSKADIRKWDYAAHWWEPSTGMGAGTEKGGDVGKDTLAMPKWPR